MKITMYVNCNLQGRCCFKSTCVKTFRITSIKEVMFYSTYAICTVYLLATFRKTTDWIFMKILQETPLWTRKIKIKFKKSCASGILIRIYGF